MIKHNTFLKRVKKQFLQINSSIEGYFNKFKYFKSNYKKILLGANNKVILGFDQYNQFIDFINNINLLEKVSKDINYSALHVDDKYLCNPSLWKI